MLLPASFLCIHTILNAIQIVFDDISDAVKFGVFMFIRHNLFGKSKNIYRQIMDPLRSGPPSQNDPAKPGNSTHPQTTVTKKLAKGVADNVKE